MHFQQLTSVLGLSMAEIEIVSFYAEGSVANHYPALNYFEHNTPYQSL